MPRRRRTNPTGGGLVGGRLFQNVLAGEEGPSLETGRRLCELAGEFYIQQPWSLLADGDLILLQDPQSGETCYCSVMGALGELFSIHVYIGPESYRLYRKVAEGAPISAGEYFALQHALSLELLQASKATAPDKHLLKAVDYPMRKGVPVPRFRAFRPGYRPWYVTQAEADLLIDCAQAVFALCSSLTASDVEKYWSLRNTYPFLSPMGSDENGRDYSVKMVKVSDPPPLLLAPAKLDAAKVDEVLRRNYPVGPALEADYFVMSSAVGKPNERKTCTRVGLVTEAGTGYLYPPEFGHPTDAPGNVLVRAILSAVHGAQCLPKEVQVKDPNYKTLLEPLALCLGFPVNVVKAIPSIEEAKDALFETMHEPKPYVAGEDR